MEGELAQVTLGSSFSAILIYMTKQLLLIVLLIVLGAAAWYFWPKTDEQGAPNPLSSGQTIDLSNQDLSEVPSYVWNQTNTKVLILSGNQITSLPSQMGNLKNLEELHVDHNQLTGALPGEIRQFQHLKILDASYNQLTGIPAEIGQLDQLHELYLNGNNIDTYPNELANLQGLSILDLRGNGFSESQITDIQNLLPSTTVNW